MMVVAAAVITPFVAVIVVLSGSTAPYVVAVDFGIAGAASERMAVIAVPLTAATPIVAVGSANVADPGTVQEPPGVHATPLIVVGLVLTTPAAALWVVPSTFINP